MSKEELYDKYKFLVLKVIKDLHCQYKNREEFEEYIFNGTIGLLNAINKYDSNIPSSSSYFYTSIRNSILVFFTKRNYNKNKINYIEMISLDTLAENNFPIYELLPDQTINIEKDFIKKQEIKKLREYLNKLKPSYKKIICDFYGIDRDKKTLAEMSIEYGVSRQAVCVKKDNALKKLRKMFKEEKYNEFND